MGLKKLKMPSTVSQEHLPHLWENNDILILIIDINDYGSLDTTHLDNIEKEHLNRLQTEYFKKRYTTSRFVLKHILCELLNEQSLSDISLYKDEYGRIHVCYHNELNICISYTGNIAALAISKTEVGVDVEIRRTLSIKSVSRYLQTETLYNSGYEGDLDNLIMWTLKEAYCKFSNKSILSCLNEELDLNNISYSSYIINNKIVLALINSSNHYTTNISLLQKIACCNKADQEHSEQ